MTTKSFTSGQRDQIKRLGSEVVGDVLVELALDREQAQKLLMNGGEFKKRLRDSVAEAMREFSLSVSDEYADEEAPSSYGYLSGYKPRPVAEQMAALKGLFPGLKSFDENAATKLLPPGAEGMFLIPRWQEIAPTYGQAVELVLAKLAETRNGRFVNYRENQLGPNQLRQSAKKIAFFKKLGKEQTGHDVLVVAAQFGLRHAGKSVRRARVVMGGNECGLGAFEVGIMLLTHPDRLAEYDDLWIDCAGDEYAPESGGGFCSAPYFRFSDEGLGFGTDGLDYPHGGCGSASAVVLPSECQS